MTKPRTPTPTSIWTHIQENFQDNKDTAPLLMKMIDEATPLEIRDRTLIIKTDNEFFMIYMKEYLTVTADNYLRGVVGVDKVEFVEEV